MLYGPLVDLQDGNSFCVLVFVNVKVVLMNKMFTCDVQTFS